MSRRNHLIPPDHRILSDENVQWFHADEWNVDVNSGFWNFKIKIKFVYSTQVQKLGGGETLQIIFHLLLTLSV